MESMVSKSNNSLVSIIVPVYNVAKYLNACLESIKRQTYGNIEVIVVDDGSTDSCAKIIDEFATNDSRFIAIHQGNRGVAAARNVGIEASHGDFLTFVDSDDWISNDYVSHLLELQDENDSDICFTTSFFIKKDDRQSTNIKIKKISNEDAVLLLLSPKLVIGTYNKLYKKEFIEKQNLRQNEKLFSGEGLHFTVTAVQLANHVTVSNKKIYYYRRNVSESATTKFNISMYTNNELSLEYIEKDRTIESKKIDDMLKYFRVQLLIGGVSAIYNYSSPSAYYNEFTRWREIIKKDGTWLILHSGISMKYKLKIIIVNLFPRFWAKLAKAKRRYIFNRSV